jgi:hypothetical protein
MSVKIDVLYQIWATTDSSRGWPTVTKIISEEEKHVDELHKSTGDLAGIAANGEKHNYMFKGLCELDCKGLELESAFTAWLPGILEQIPGLNPHHYDD